MKTFLRKATLALAAVSVAISTMAQSIDFKKECNVRLGDYIHSALMKDGIHLYDAERDKGEFKDENGNWVYKNILKSLTIINSDLETVKEFTSGPLFEEFEEPTVEYAAKTLKVDRISINENYDTEDFYDNVFEMDTIPDIAYKEDIEAAIAYKIADGELFETTYNGTRILYESYDVVKSEYFDWGYQYPSKGWYFKDYDDIQFVSFHYSADEKEEISRYISRRFNIFTAASSWYIDFSNGTESECLGTISQTIFNDDDKFEFLLPILKQTEITYSNEYNYTKRTRFSYRCEGCKVVSEDGTVLHEIKVPVNDSEDADYYSNAYIVKLSDKTYLCIEQSNSEVIPFYEIKKNGNNSSINKVRDVRGMNIRPTIAGRNENITITLNDGDNDADRELIVTGLNGQLVERRTIPAGENQLEINAGMLRSGMYNFTLQKKGSFVDNGKVIVK